MKVNFRRYASEMKLLINLSLSRFATAPSSEGAKVNNANIVSLNSISVIYVRTNFLPPSDEGLPAFRSLGPRLDRGGGREKLINVAYLMI